MTTVLLVLGGGLALVAAFTWWSVATWTPSQEDEGDIAFREAWGENARWGDPEPLPPDPEPPLPADIVQSFTDYAAPVTTAALHLHRCFTDAREALPGALGEAAAHLSDADPHVQDLIRVNRTAPTPAGPVPRAADRVVSQVGLCIARAVDAVESREVLARGAAGGTDTRLVVALQCLDGLLSEVRAFDDEWLAGGVQAALPSELGPGSRERFTSWPRPSDRH